MNDFQRTKEFFDLLKIPYTLNERDGYGNIKEMLLCLNIKNDDSNSIVDGYRGFATTFMFHQDGSLFKMAIWR